MDGVAGQGPRPDFLDPKYPNMAEQARASKEAQKRLGATSGAPDAYDFGSYRELIDTENPHIKDYVEWAKQNRINQEAFNKTLETFVNYENAKKPDFEAEKAKLGPNAEQKLATVKQWMENNFSQKAVDAWVDVAGKAEVIEFLDELRQFQYHQETQPPAPGGVDSITFKPLTVEEVTNEMETNYKKYQGDKNYREEIRKKFEQALGS